MQINQVEQRTGVSKKNIRFYEQQGLLNPARQSGNGYRDYSEADVAAVCRIKLLRKLDVPLQEIHAMLEGRMTLVDGMRRHLVMLEHKQQDLESAMRLTTALAQQSGWLRDLDAAEQLAQIEVLEQKGVRFMEEGQRSKERRMHSATIAAGIMLIFTAALEALMVWGVLSDTPPLLFAMLLLALPLVLAAGVLLALYQRVKQIKGGEEDAARQY